MLGCFVNDAGSLGEVGPRGSIRSAENRRTLRDGVNNASRLFAE